MFFELCPSMIIGITGANGKSTTSSLTAHLLKDSMKGQVWLTGNIGNEPFLIILDHISHNDLVVIEISSFQVEQLAQSKLAPNVAVLTNLTPNHLDRYGTFENYCKAKELLFQFQKPDGTQPAVSIFNGDDKIGCEWFEKYKQDNKRRCVKFSTKDVGRDIASKFTLPGRANLSNLAAALAVVRSFGVTDKQVIRSLPGFKALPHRLQLVADIKGVRWFNDSKATTPDSAIVALEAFDNPIIIAGGYDKHIPFDDLGKKIAEKAKASILIGQTAAAIEKAIKKSSNDSKIYFALTLAEAVKIAAEISDSGDVVLLSPACASYDMFENYEQRGELFIEFVTKLMP